MSLAEGTVLKIAQSILLPDTQTAINVFWAALFDDVGSGPLDEDDVLEAAANWLDAIYGNLEGVISDKVVSLLADVWEVDQPTGDLTPIGDEATTWVGGAIPDAVPNGVAAICSLKTTDTEVTGRKFFPGFDESLVVDNNLTGAALTGLVLFADGWSVPYVDANDVGFTFGVYSPTKAQFYAATGVSVSNAIVGYQRRRKPGVGS